MAKGGTIVNDPNIAALSKMTRIMDGLDPEGRIQVLEWITKRERSRLPAPSPTDAPSTPSTSESATAGSAGKK